MRRLKFVVEETGPGLFEVRYCGQDAAKADEALRAPTARTRALFNYPSPIAYNRPVIAKPVEAALTEAPQAAEPVEPTKPIETPAEAPKKKKK